MLTEITPLILTWNEAPNIARTLRQLRWAHRIVIIDSFSTDDTLDLIREFYQAEVIQRRFESFAGQCNFGLEQVCTSWVLSLDADYFLPDDFITEIESLNFSNGADAYAASFNYCVFGRPLRSALYPPRTILFRKAAARYEDQGHSHRVRIVGQTRMLTGRIQHDDRKSLDRWFTEQLHYSAEEAEYLLKTPVQELNRADRIRRKTIVAPVLIFFYTLFGKGLIVDGWRGWFYVLQRTLAEVLLSLRLIETRLGGSISQCFSFNRTTDSISSIDRSNIETAMNGSTEAPRHRNNRWMKRCLIAVSVALVLAGLGIIAALFFSRNLLCIQDAATKGDAIVLLGGEVLWRPPRTLELYQEGAAPRIFVTGKGDCQEYRTLLVGKGVPSNVIEIECDSRTTRENARFTVPLLRKSGAKRVILVTSWFHSRRALHCFRHYAPDIEFISRPTIVDQPTAHWPDKRERGWVLAEYVKLAGYWVCYGVKPV